MLSENCYLGVYGRADVGRADLTDVCPPREPIAQVSHRYWYQRKTELLNIFFLLTIVSKVIFPELYSAEPFS